MNYFLSILAAVLWGVSGTVAQPLFQFKGVEVEWLVTVRLLASGLILLGFSFYKKRSRPFEIWKNKRDILVLICFSVFGMIAIQHTYFVAIKLSNAATATVLQYLGPVFIVTYYVFMKRRLPKQTEVIALAFAMFGTFLLVTHGDIGSLVISSEAFIWGILSAVALAVYSIMPIRLLNKYGSSQVIGWSMLLGGLIFSFVHSPFDIPANGFAAWDLQTKISIPFIIIFGTLIPYYCYLSALKVLGAQKSSILACAEPLSAAFLSVIWLKTPFGIYDWFGSACVIATVFILTWRSKR